MTPFNPLPPLPVQRPFRVGITSYVYPDEILPNVEALAGRVDDIELILFESGDASNLPSADVIARLAELGGQHNLTYSVHFPIDRALGSADPVERTAMRRQMEQIVRLTQPLPVSGYILHFEGITAEAVAARVQVWQRDIAVELRLFFAGADKPAPGKFCVENLNFPFSWCDPLLAEFGLSVCADVGHLWRYGVAVEDFFHAYLPRTRVVHLHGEREGRDHLPLTALEPERLDDVLRRLRAFSGVVTLEVFEYDAARLSVETLTSCLEKNAGN